ncbi:MAG: A24 family peptidase [Acidimicrobiia bacterium]|nr:A24 family peptidase [Acidimicrobiia bacterium]
MIAATTAIRVSSLVLGLVAGVVAVYLARSVPPRMELESRSRPNWWWGAAVIVGGCFGWVAAPSDAQLVPAFAAFGAVTLALALIDLDHQLIPNRVLFPGLGIAGGLLVLGSLLAGEGSGLLRGVLGSVLYFLVLLLVGLLARGGFGMGDVKLALLLGLFLGFVGWDALGVGAILAVVLGGVASVLLLVARRSRKSKFAYGPFLVVGAWIALAWGTQIADWYLRRG